MKSGIIGNARPCFNCLKMMQDIGINKVYYSTGIGNEIVYEYVKDMISIQSSSITRHYHFIKKNIEYNNLEETNYYENLIKKIFPKKIKEDNLFYFLEYNFKNVLPTYTYLITNTNNIKNIIIYNDKNKMIVNASII